MAYINLKRLKELETKKEQLNNLERRYYKYSKQLLIGHLRNFKSIIEQEIYLNKDMQFRLNNYIKEIETTLEPKDIV